MRQTIARGVSIIEDGCLRKCMRGGSVKTKGRRFVCMHLGTAQTAGNRSIGVYTDPKKDPRSKYCFMCENELEIVGGTR